ncbi:8-oxo-dGTP diphosphatase MutT [Acinetobacter sp.]|uniref:8-oxo-dGTP diphosphatase MutT n=1 Tax=Acinetobacter sp. TaxID=472 RepID=UPI0035AD9E03
MKKHIQVSIAIIRHKNQVLLGWRDENLHQGGCYEFAGGKLEARETPEHAVIREVQEEVDIDVMPLKRFASFQFDYSDRCLSLFFILCKVKNYAELDKMDQAWRWIDLDDVQNYQFPKANQAIIQRISWSRRIAILNGDHTAKQQVHHDVVTIYLRQSDENLKSLLIDNPQLFVEKKVIVRWQDYQQLNDDLQEKVFAIHLNSQQLVDLAESVPQNNELPLSLQNKNLIGACHNENEIECANLIACDAIFISPVQATPTHPEQSGLGWESFSKLTAMAEMPVYALGGVGRDDLDVAKAYGAYGVAGIRDFLRKSH